MKTKLIFLILPVALLLSSCLRSSYEYVSYREPDVPMKHYKKVCVFADIEDPFAKKELELYVGRRLFERGMNAIPGHTVIPPTRERTNEEIHEILTSNSFDAFLKISFEDAREMTKYVPETSTSTTVVKEKIVPDKKNRNRETRDSKHNYKDKKHKVTTKETTVTNTPAHTYNYILGSLNIRLIDIETSKVAYIQNINAGGYESQFRLADLRDDHVQRAVARTVANGLMEKGYLPKRH